MLFHGSRGGGESPFYGSSMDAVRRLHEGHVTVARRAVDRDAASASCVHSA
jgi:hypothetical protein